MGDTKTDGFVLSDATFPLTYWPTVFPSTFYIKLDDEDYIQVKLARKQPPVASEEPLEHP